MLRLFLAEISGLSVEPNGLSLSEYRLSRLEKIKLPDKRKQSIGAELLLIYAVQAVCPQVCTPLEIECGFKGKPEFKNIPLHFSISHSGNFVACAVSDDLVGLDIEVGLSYKPRVSQRFFNEKELCAIESSDNKDIGFSLIWTAKESIAKYYGTGLSAVLSEIDTLDSEKYNIFQTVFENVVISVCSANKHGDTKLELVELV